MKMRLVIVSLLAVGLSAFVGATTYEVTLSGVSYSAAGSVAGLQEYGSAPGMATPFTLSYLYSGQLNGYVPGSVTYGIELLGATVNGHKVTELPTSAPYDYFFYVNDKPAANPTDVSIRGIWDDPFGQVADFSLAGPNLISTEDFPDFNSLDLSKATAENRMTLGYVFGNDLSLGFTELDAKVSSVSLQVVPEPTTVAALGLGVLALVRRRRR